MMPPIQIMKNSETFNDQFVRKCLKNLIFDTYRPYSMDKDFFEVSAVSPFYFIDTKLQAKIKKKLMNSL